MVSGVVTLLEDAGANIYVDWADNTMPETPNRVTAEKIQNKILELDYFLFLATPNSLASRWCPWEIGYADGRKPTNQIIIIPTTDDSGRNHGNEYLDLYHRLDLDTLGQLLVYRPGQLTGGFSPRSL